MIKPKERPAGVELIALAGIYVVLNIALYPAFGRLTPFGIFDGGFRLIVVWIGPVLGIVLGIVIGVTNSKCGWAIVAVYLAFMLCIGWLNNWLILKLAESV